MDGGIVVRGGREESDGVRIPLYLICRNYLLVALALRYDVCSETNDDSDD